MKQSTGSVLTAMLRMHRSGRPNDRLDQEQRRLRKGGLCTIVCWLTMSCATTCERTFAADRDSAGYEDAIPVAVEAGEPIIDVLIDGRGPFPMIVDTGAANTLTPETAALLGLEIIGSGTALTSSGRATSSTFTQVSAIQLGHARLTDQSFGVVPMPLYFTDRGHRSPLAGLIGYEVLAEFVVRLDYANKTMTLTPASSFHYAGNGAHLLLGFTGNTPTVQVAADGIPGAFAIDTGSQGGLTPRREFVERSHLESHHPRQLRIKSGAVDAPYEAIMTRLDRFDIAGSRIDRPATRFPSNANATWPPFADVDGSIGYEILRQFVLTFDYAHHDLWLERSAAFGTKSVQGTTGFQAMKTDSSGFRIITVLPDSPAMSAGIAVGDQITEVDGIPAASLSQAEFGDVMQRPDGTVLQLQIVRSGKTLAKALTLRELLP